MKLLTNTHRCPARVLFATLPEQGGYVPVAQNANREPWAILPPTQFIKCSTANEELGVEDPGPPVAHRNIKSGWHVPPAPCITSWARQELIFTDWMFMSLKGIPWGFFPLLQSSHTHTDCAFFA